MNENAYNYGIKNQSLKSMRKNSIFFALVNSTYAQ